MVAPKKKNFFKKTFLIALTLVPMPLSAMDAEKENDSNPFAELYGIDFKSNEKEAAFREHFQSDLFRFFGTDDGSHVQELIESLNIDINARLQPGYYLSKEYPITFAAEVCNYKIIPKLIQCGANTSQWSSEDMARLITSGGLWNEVKREADIANTVKAFQDSGVYPDLQQKVLLLRVTTRLMASDSE